VYSGFGHGIAHRRAAIFQFSLIFCLFCCLIQAGAAQDAESLNEEGVALLRAGDYSVALDTLDRAIAADQGYMPARVNRGIALLSLGRAQDSLLTFEVVLDQDPGNTPAWMYRGDALLALGRPDEARESYITAGEIESDNPLVRERIERSGAGGSLQGITGFSLPVILGAGGIIVGSVIAVAVVLKKRKAKGSTVRAGDDSSAPKKIRSFFSKIDIRGTKRREPAPVNTVESKQSAEKSGKVLSEKGKALTGLVSSIRRMSHGVKNENPAADGPPTSCIGNMGPLQMAGGEIVSSEKGDRTHADHESRDQIIGGFHRILADSGIDSSGFRGLSHYAMGNYGEALQEFITENRVDQGYPGILTLQASTLLRMGRTNEALQCCEAALRDGKGSFEIRKIQGNILERMGRWEDTLRVCDEALSLNPHSVEVWALRGRALHGLKRDHEALQSCDRALGMDPASTELLQQKAVILADLGRVDDALSTLDLGISANHTETSLLLEKGRILHKSGRPREAMKEFDSALALAPDDHEAWRELAKVFHTMEDPMEEAAAWERASALCPDNITYVASWGDALRDGGEYLASAKVYLKGIQKSRRDISLWHRLGDSLYSAEKYNDSTKAFQFIIKESPQDGNAWKNLGYSLLRAGKPEEAISAFLKAEPLISGDPTIAEGIRRAKAASHEGIQKKESPSSLEKPLKNEAVWNADDEKIRLPRGSDFHELSPGKLDENTLPAGIPKVTTDHIPSESRNRIVKEQEGRFS